MKKTLKIKPAAITSAGALCGILSLPLMAVSGQGGASIGLDYTYLGAQVGDMPQSIRNVPVHPDDSEFSGNQGPIGQLKYRADQSLALSIMYDWELGAKETRAPRFSLGIGLDWLFLPQVGVGGDEAERNYTDAPGTSQRGTGAALTYVGLRQGGAVPPLGGVWSDVLLNWSPRVKFEVAPFSGSFRDLRFGTSVSYYFVDAQTGWDRFDQNQVRKDYVLERVIPVRLYVSMLFGGDDSEGRFGVALGAQLQPGEKTAIGRQADVSVQPVTGFAELFWRF